MAKVQNFSIPEPGSCRPICLIKPMPLEGAEKLAEFMADFKKKNA